jgi:hypothetical protein
LSGESAERGPWYVPSERAALSCFASALLHSLLLVLLAILVQAGGARGDRPVLTATITEQGKADAVVEAPATELPIARAPIAGNETIPSTAIDELQVAPPRQAPTGLREIGVEPEQTDLFATATGPAGGLGNRAPQARSARVGSGDGGPSRESEAAVERGLRWLAAHQMDDGSWQFDHRKSACQGLCGNPGSVLSTTGATAISLLAFLGAGYTHQAGEHQRVVDRGLYQLRRRAIMTPAGADLQDGTMYAQGLSAIALCEAYAMTKDPGLKNIAREAINFIVYAQDKHGGGWRYTPGAPGDTTVTGWQLMALKSGQMAGFRVPSSTWVRAEQFLNSVQASDGRYGYMDKQPRPATTAVGLLCRMYGGWKNDHPMLVRGVEFLNERGPSATELYYDYYATQVLFHWGGSDWKRWNRGLRDHLVAAQVNAGHEAGSWYFPGEHGEKGGRIYCTAIAVMILEVYYRYMPLYTHAAVEGGP